MPLRPIDAAKPGHSTQQTTHVPAAARASAPVPLRVQAHQGQAATPPQAPRRLIPTVLRLIGAWLMTLWAACSALWRSKPAASAPTPAEAALPAPAAMAPDAVSLADMARTPMPQPTPPNRSATPKPSPIPMPLPAPMRRTLSCPAAIHHAGSATPSPLSTPSADSILTPPPDSATQHLGASYVLVDTPAADVTASPKGWLSYFYGVPTPEASKTKPLALVGPHHVTALIREQLITADTHEHQGALSNDPNHLLAGTKPATLLGADGRWLGLARQFPTDAHRQTVYVTTRDAMGNDHTVALGSYQSRRATVRYVPGSIDAMADHLLRICDGDVRWRFQLTQLINQTLPNAVAHSLVTSHALTLDGTPIAMLGNSHNSHFEVVRRSHKRLHVNHTSVWRGEPGATDEEGLPKTLPFYVDTDGTPHRFTGEVRQMLKISLSRPRKQSEAPRLGDMTINVFGNIADDSP